jgi:hypothetical protein
MKRLQGTLSYIGVGLIGLVIGFFIGREYLKYELRTAFQSAFGDFQKELSTVVAGNSTSRSPKSSTDKAVNVTSASVPPPVKLKEPAPVAVTVVEKGFKAADPERGDFEDDVTLVLSIKNLTARDVRALDGTLRLTDLLDNEIIAIALAINDPIQAGGTFTWNGGVRYNQFLDADQRLRAARRENIKTHFIPKQILFTDGSTKQYQEN